jgi:hypothetical protein
VWDLNDNFFSAFNNTFVPRKENTMADSLATSASQFNIPQSLKFRYDVEIRYRPFVPDTIKH